MLYDNKVLVAMVLASTAAVAMASCSSTEEGSDFGATQATGTGPSSGAFAAGPGGGIGVGAGGNTGSVGVGASTGGAGVGSSNGGAGVGSSSGGAGVGGSSNVGGAGGSSNVGVGGSSSVGVGGSFIGVTQCTDGIDNDNDGWIDAFDVECTGPLDNDESSFATGIPGDNSDPCKQDCFFDGNSGSGNDGCLWNLKCDPLSPGAPDCPYDPNFNNCPPGATQACIDFCGQFTPNGCDCFGCCTIFVGSMDYTVKLGGSCDLSTIADPNICKPCTKVASCDNPCDTCEYCLGKTQLPPECNQGGAGGMGSGGSGVGGMGGMGGMPTCPANQQVCTPTMPCPAAYYCLTGCCILIPT